MSKDGIMDNTSRRLSTEAGRYVPHTWPFGRDGNEMRPGFLNI